MKKTTKTTTTTLATPALSPAKKTASKAIKTEKAPAKKTASAAAPVAIAAPAVKSAPTASVSTKIVAKIDVGFGNTLYVRGEGPGLSWERGVPLDCVADDQWAITLAEAARPIVFKFLINDLTWSLGDDYLAQPGVVVELTPSF